ncbi:hypothetical protein SDC9_66292 [bioreactor metagenome]|uniref:Uncharacterized protein n=1 Tax=bioreactor metagenome TaxID=1076179 RepID=A0A644XUM3_9ZZZZ
MKNCITLLFILISFQLFAQQTNWNEGSIKKHWQSNGIEAYEGIYEEILNSYDVKIGVTPYKLAFLKENNGIYKLIFLNGGDKSFINNWRIGDIKASLSETATENIFKVKWRMGDKTISENLHVAFDIGVMKIYWSHGTIDTYLKLYPTSNESVRKNQEPSKMVSGTGFAIFSNGIIVTNYHVIEGATAINVKGINSDFNSKFKAKILVTDKTNDLALIQINDDKFTALGSIPYTIKSNIAGVGENIFVLGYPLRATMGDEIKLTNGIISSKTGYQGDITSYQISAPVQPGNSGGPLFDSQGALIGIINAKHTGAENASYAVKVSYLTNLIDLIPSTPKLQTINSLMGKTLTQQVEMAKKFVYIIEIE